LKYECAGIVDIIEMKRFRYAFKVTKNTYRTWSEKFEDWMPVNHSCDPNAWLDQLAVVARRNISSGEEVCNIYLEEKASDKSSLARMVQKQPCLCLNISRAKRISIIFCYMPLFLIDSYSFEILSVGFEQSQLTLNIFWD